MIEKGLPIPAYELCIKASHCFNLLDARGLISVTERQAYILRIRSLVQKCCLLIVEKMNNFLLEIYSEEIPSSAQKLGEKELAENFNLLFDKEGISYSSLKTFLPKKNHYCGRKSS